jgi:hypothetical protein
LVRAHPCTRLSRIDALTIASMLPGVAGIIQLPVQRWSETPRSLELIMSDHCVRSLTSIMLSFP